MRVQGAILEGYLRQGGQVSDWLGNARGCALDSRLRHSRQPSRLQELTSCLWPHMAGSGSNEPQVDCGEEKLNMIARPQTTTDIIKWRKANPEMTMTEIGHKVGRSRERVRQILVRAGLPTHIPYQPWENHCVDCGKSITPYQGAKRCRKCASHHRFGTTIVKFNCASCEAETTRTSGTIACQSRNRERRGLPPQTRWFCSRVCQGRYVGTHYGRGKPIALVGIYTTCSIPTILVTIAENVEHGN